jgi:acetyl-CoA carboxylase carboxyl transferase subunit beta
MAWFRKEKKPKAPPEHRRISVPEGLWLKCLGCGELIFRREVEHNDQVCPKCGYHFRVSWRQRLEALLDGGVWEEFDRELSSVDPLRFKDMKLYRDRLKQSRDKTGLNEAVVNVVGTLDAIPVIVSVLEFAFLGGSMGSVVGEKVTRGAERALAERRAFISISCSGGARMQEGALSLMQMAKISAALARLDEARLPFISVLTDPTTGGVTASFAMLGDLNVAEPKALIGFAGPRVIEQTIRQKLPDGFQRSEFLVEHGMVDLIVERAEMKSTLARCLRLLWPEAPPASANPVAGPPPAAGS